jgi:uncharacterized protein
MFKPVNVAFNKHKNSYYWINLPEKLRYRPFSEFVAKIISYCNLNCSYCYMFNQGDETYKGLPKRMSDVVRNAMTERIINHADRHNLHDVSIGLHGGEPLLFGKQQLIDWVSYVRRRLNECSINSTFALQTNGVLIDKEWTDIFDFLNVTVGVSIDGPEKYHNMYRVDHQGHKSFTRVLSGIECLRNHPNSESIFGGILAVINPEIPPNEFFQFILSTNPRSCDIRMPLANYKNLSPQHTVNIGQWLISLFDIWFDFGPERPFINLFSSVLLLFLGDKNINYECIGTGSNGLVIIETDGGIEPSDNLKPCGDGFTKIGFNVLNNEFDDSYSHPLIHISQQIEPMISDQCSECDLLKICGSGHLTERYDPLSGFDNPSIYCLDYKIFLYHVKHRLTENMPKSIQSKLGFFS